MAFFAHFRLDLITMLILASQPVAGGDKPALAVKSDKARVDAYGDALPPGVVARLGTTRLRHPSIVGSLAYSRDGRWIVSVSESVRLWEGQTGKELRRFRTSGRPWLSPDGKILIAGSHGPRFWDVDTGKELPWSPGEPATSTPYPPYLSLDHVVYSADGRTARLWGLWNENNSVAGVAMEEWDVVAGKLRDRVRLPSGSIPSPDCKTCLTRMRDVTGDVAMNGLELCTIGSDKSLQYWKGEQLLYPQFTPDGKILTVVEPDHIVAWDVASGKRLYRIRMDKPKDENQQNSPFAPIMSPDSKWMVSRTSQARCLWVWEAATGKIKHKITPDAPCWRVTFSPNGHYLAAANSDTDPGSTEIRVYDMDTAKIACRIKTAPRTFTDVMAFSPDAETLAIAGAEAIEQFEIPSGKPKGQIGRAHV